MYSENLKKLRKELRVTALELADNLGISANSINNYENGRRKPNFEFLELLVQVYNVNLNWLITGKGEMFIGQDKTDHTKIDEAEFKKLFKQCMKEEGFI
jgi:transcriptional regulator with XRE-family HTH domain